MNEPNDDDAGEFAPLDTLDLLAAYLFKRYGAESMRAHFESVGGFTFEDLADIADELEGRGLDQAATVMREMAEDCPRGLDLNPHAKDSKNWPLWRNRWIMQRASRTGQNIMDLFDQYRDE